MLSPVEHHTKRPSAMREPGAHHSPCIVPRRTLNRHTAISRFSQERVSPGCTTAANFTSGAIATEVVRRTVVGRARPSLVTVRKLLLHLLRLQDLLHTLRLNQAPMSHAALN